MKKIKNLIANIMVSLIAFIIMLFLTEFAIRIFAPQNLSGNWYVLSEKGYLINKASWTTKHQFNDIKVSYRINALHLRGDEINHQKFKILAMGDSFTFGWLLNEDKTYVSLLQDYCNENYGLDTIQFINGGTGGWGLADFNEYLKEFGDYVQPNMLIVYFNTDDIGRSIYRTKYFDPKSKLRMFKRKITSSSAYVWLLEHSHFVQWVKIKYLNLNFGKTLENQVVEFEDRQVVVPSSILENQELIKAVELGKNIFQELNLWCRERNIPMIVLTTGWHFNQNNNQSDPEVIFLEQSEDFFGKLNIPFFDISDDVGGEIGNRINDYIIKEDYHPNEEGAYLIAKYSWIKLDSIVHNNYTEWVSKPKYQTTK